MSILQSFLEFLRAEGAEWAIEGRWVSDFDEFEALIGEELAKVPERRAALEPLIQEYVWLYEGEPALGECDESSFFYHDSIVFHDRKSYVHAFWREGSFSCLTSFPSSGSSPNSGSGDEKVRRALRWRLEHWAVRRAVPAVMRLVERAVESV